MSASACPRGAVGRRGSPSCWNWSASAGFARRHPHELSGGQQQRVALARALAPDRPGPAGRALLLPRRRAARRDRRAVACARRGRGDRDPRHPRPGRGAVAGDAGRGPRQGTHRGRGQPAGALQCSGQPAGCTFLGRGKPVAGQSFRRCRALRDRRAEGPWRRCPARRHGDGPRPPEQLRLTAGGSVIDAGPAAVATVTAIDYYGHDSLTELQLPGPHDGGGQGGASSRIDVPLAAARGAAARAHRRDNGGLAARSRQREHRCLQRGRALSGSQHDQARDPARRARAGAHRPGALVILAARTRARAQLLQPGGQRPASARGRSGAGRPRGTRARCNCHLTCCGYLLEAGERAIEPANVDRKPLPPSTVVDQPAFPCCKNTTAHDLGTLLVSLTLAAAGHGPALRQGITAREARVALWLLVHAAYPGLVRPSVAFPVRRQGRLAARHPARRRARVLPRGTLVAVFMNYSPGGRPRIRACRPLRATSCGSHYGDERATASSPASAALPTISARLA